MHKIFAIIRKDALLKFSSRVELLFFIILPLIFTYLLAGGTPSGNEDPRIELLVVDEAQSAVSQEIIRELETSSAIRPETVTRAKAEADFQERRAEVALFIPAGLDADSLQKGSASLDLRQQPNNVNATVAERAIQTALLRVSSAVQAANNAVAQREKQAPFQSESEKTAYFKQALETAQKVQADTPQRVRTTQAKTQDDIDYDPGANSSAGQLITWVFIPLFGISQLFAEERSQGTLRRLLTTPTRKATYLIGTIFGQVGIAVIQMLLLVGFGMLVLGVQWGRDPLALLILLVASALAAAGIGVGLGAFVKTPGQANGLSIMLGMLMALMGGCWYPLELFPPAIQTAVRILPTTWAMQGILELVTRGGGLIDIIPETAVLLGFAAVFLSLGIWRFRYE